MYLIFIRFEKRDLSQNFTLEENCDKWSMAMIFISNDYVFRFFENILGKIEPLSQITIFYRNSITFFGKVAKFEKKVSI